MTSFIRKRPNLSHEPLLDVLRLIRCENVGPITFFQLLDYFGTAKTALDGIPDMSRKGGRAKAIKVCSTSIAEAEIDRMEQFGASMIRYGEPSYPELLMEIYDPPPVITVLGQPHLWKRTNIAMVGSRNASANGCQFAAKLAKDIGARGITIVSGMARGLDTAAHRGALETGTVGVIAGGIDNVYPPENKPLFDKMRELGAIISEQPFGAMPHSQAFPARNRIIAGMSVGTVVVEATLKSGSLITARFAGDQGREVFAVPGAPMDPRGQGSNKLLREGAILTESAQDVFDGLEALRRNPLKEGRESDFTYAPSNGPVEEGELSSVRRLLHEKLSLIPVSIDILVQECQLPPQIVHALLLELELAGRLSRSPGNRVALRQIDESTFAD